MDSLPDALRGRQYYRPTARGQEAETAARLEAARRIRQRARKDEPPPKD
jgi:replication-associated recombination protein RarA